jgi:hypothetical protein
MLEATQAMAKHEARNTPGQFKYYSAEIIT